MTKEQRAELKGLIAQLRTLIVAMEVERIGASGKQYDYYKSLLPAWKPSDAVSIGTSNVNCGELLSFNGLPNVMPGN